MPKWKVYVTALPPIRTDHASDSIHVIGEYARMDDTYQPRTNALRVYGLSRIGDVSKNQIPKSIIEDNGSGYSFIRLRDGITIDDFELEVLE